MIGSVSVMDGSLESDAQWRWPLQLGVLPGSVGAKILAKAGRDPAISRFVDPVMLGDHTSTCDLLLVPGRDGLAALGDVVGVDANCIGLLGVRCTADVIGAADAPPYPGRCLARSPHGDSCGFRGPGEDQRIVFSLDQGYRGSIYGKQIVTSKGA
jgi:hypothetical protein